MKMIALRRFPFFTVSLSELPTAMTAWMQIFSLMVTVQKGCTNSMSPAESIHLREKNIAGPTERSRKGGEPPAQARRAGPAFFDEDDVDAGSGNIAQPD